MNNCCFRPIESKVTLNLTVYLEGHKKFTKIVGDFDNPAVAVAYLKTQKRNIRSVEGFHIEKTYPFHKRSFSQVRREGEVVLL